MTSKVDKQRAFRMRVIEGAKMETEKQPTNGHATDEAALRAAIIAEKRREKQRENLAKARMTLKILREEEKKAKRKVKTKTAASKRRTMTTVTVSEFIRIAWESRTVEAAAKACKMSVDAAEQRMRNYVRRGIAMPELEGFSTGEGRRLNKKNLREAQALSAQLARKAKRGR